MPEIPVKEWPQYRLNPSNRERLEAILSRAGLRDSLTDVLNNLIAEALAQIESIEPSPPAMITLHRLRQASGRRPLSEPGDLAQQVLEGVGFC